MTAILHKIVAVLLLVAFLAGSVLVVLYSAGTSDSWNDAVQYLASAQFTVFCAAIAVFCSVTIFALTSLPHTPRDRYLSFPSEGGTMSISLRGMSSFISNLGSEFDAVKWMRARVVPGHKQIDVIVDIKIKEGTQISEICHLLQQRVRESLRDSLSVADVREVKINVREIVALRHPSWSGQGA